MTFKQWWPVAIPGWYEMDQEARAEVVWNAATESAKERYKVDMEELEELRRFVRVLEGRKGTLK